MWNWRMLLTTGEARYADLLERSLYNGFLLNGVMAVKVQGRVAELGEWEDYLYLPVAERKPKYHAATLAAVPYYAWANRGPGEMRVWIPHTECFK
jgi:DUF1680 family protein